MTTAQGVTPDILTKLTQTCEHVAAGYQHREREHLAAHHLALLGLYGTSLATFLVGANKRLPKHVPPADLALLGVATHKLSRIITRDIVTTPLRAPFTEYQGKAGAGEVNEKARGDGMKKVIGELLTCPYCIAPWLAASLFAIYTASPRAGRALGSIFSIVTVSDFLQQAYAAAKKLS